MRSHELRAIFVAALALTMTACAPSVELPTGNDKSTSDQATPEKVLPPKVAAPPSPYPYSTISITGAAGTSAIRVLIEGAGNPVSATVQPTDQTFCVDVLLAAAPATYTLTIRSQDGVGDLSEPTTVTVQRSNDAPPPADAKLCDGTPAGN